MSGDPLDMFAARMNKRAKYIGVRVDKLVKEVFEVVATQVFTHNPVQSSQSVVNWTASIGHTPTIRRVNVDRSGVGIKHNKVTGSGGEGTTGNITVHVRIAAEASIFALRAAIGVSDGYKRSVTGKNQSIWLSNSISYTPNLWTGRWISNPMTLAQAVGEGILVIQRTKLL